MKRPNILSSCTKKLFVHIKTSPLRYLHPSKGFLLLSVGPAAIDTLLGQWTWIKSYIVTSVMGFCVKKRSVSLSWPWVSNVSRRTEIRKLSQKVLSFITKAQLPLEGCWELNLNETFSWGWVGVPVGSAFAVAELLSCSLLPVTILYFPQIGLNHCASYQSQPWLFEMPIYDGQSMNLLQITGKVFLNTCTLSHFSEDQISILQVFANLHGNQTLTT